MNSVQLSGMLLKNMMSRAPGSRRGMALTYSWLISRKSPVQFSRMMLINIMSKAPGSCRRVGDNILTIDTRTEFNAIPWDDVDNEGDRSEGGWSMRYSLLAPQLINTNIDSSFIIKAFQLPPERRRIRHIQNIIREVIILSSTTSKNSLRKMHFSIHKCDYEYLGDHN